MNALITPCSCCCMRERPIARAFAASGRLIKGIGTSRHLTSEKFSRKCLSTKTCSMAEVEQDPNPAPAPQKAPTCDTLRHEISNLAREAFQHALGKWKDVEPLVVVCGNPKFGDYQVNNAMSIWSNIKKNKEESEFKNPVSIAEAIVRNLPRPLLVENVSVKAGFINIEVSSAYISKRLNDLLLFGIDTWAPTLPVNRAVVDFSSPNIAKEMHVGHLRSTIIGDSIARMLEFSKVTVLRRNHVGDWGTQFGMLIEYLFEMFPNWREIGEQAIGDLQEFYKKSKIKFDEDEEFKKKAQLAVVKLQGGDPTYRAAWEVLCNISRNEFQQVYDRLRVVLEERGESFYNPYIPNTIKLLDEQGVLEKSKGARVIFVEGHNIPLIVIKSDGGYNYASTDLAALWYRLNVEKVEWIIIITDVGQQQHFDMFFKAAKKAGWLPDEGYPRPQHIGFGLVLGSDGKRFRTRQGSGLVRLVDLLDEAKKRCKDVLLSKLEERRVEAENKGQTAEEWSEQEIEDAAEAVGYGAVKYADLKNNRLTNYIFDYDQMLDIRGNTAVYLLYAFARIRSIIRKSGKDIGDLKKNGAILISNPDERALGLHLIKFSETLEDSIMQLLPSTLCDYLYNLSEHFTRFYTNCKVIGSPEETSRLLLCEATAAVMRQCFMLLGIIPLERL